MLSLDLMTMRLGLSIFFDVAFRYNAQSPNILCFILRQVKFTMAAHRHTVPVVQVKQSCDFMNTAHHLMAISTI